MEWYFFIPTGTVVLILLQNMFIWISECDLLEVKCTHVKSNQSPLGSVLDMLRNIFIAPFSAPVMFVRFLVAALDVPRLSFSLVVTVFPSNLKFKDYGHFTTRLCFLCIRRLSGMLDTFCILKSITSKIN